MKIFIIGPLPLPLGGTRVLFAQLLTELTNNSNISFKYINSIPLRKNIIFSMILLLNLYFLLFMQENLIILGSLWKNFTFLLYNID